jgi:hypothetical protein
MKFNEYLTSIFAFRLLPQSLISKGRSSPGMLSLALILFSLHTAFAQSDDVSPNFVGIGYFSEGGFYPGFTLIAERSLLANRTFEILAAVRLGAYFHYR